MRYVLIGLGLITLALAVVLAWEGQWWAAIPDAFFGAGIPWVAWVSLQDEKHAGRRAPQPEPLAAPVAEAASVAGAATPAPSKPEPLPLPPPPPVPRPAPRPIQARPRKRRRR